MNRFIEGVIKDIADPDNWCSICDDCRMPYDKFCGTCGTPNPHFDATQFHREFGEPIDGYNCVRNGWHDQGAFCSVCGVHLAVSVQ